MLLSCARLILFIIPYDHHGASLLLLHEFSTYAFTRKYVFDLDSLVGYARIFSFHLSRQLLVRHS